MLPFVDRPELPYEVLFFKLRFLNKHQSFRTCLGGFLKDFLGFENMGDMGWAGNALFGPWGGVTWAQLRYAGDGDSQFAWGGHEKAEKRDRV